MVDDRILCNCIFCFSLGQALILLTKHDFLRRSPDGGEVLYYALRRLIRKLVFIIFTVEYE